MAMTAEEAYAEAERRIEKARVEGATKLVLSDLETLATLPPLQALSGLQTLYLYNTQVTDITPLQALSALQSLDLGNTQISDIAPLQALSALQTLSLTNTQVTDITPLQALSALQLLYLNNTQVTDIAPLQALSALQTLDLDNTQVTDITPLQALSGLQTLYLNNTQVTDFRPIAQHPFTENKSSVFFGLSFKSTPATAASKTLAELSEIKNHRERTDKTRAYLRSLPPYPAPLPWEPKTPKARPIQTAQTQIAFILSHAATSQMSARTTSEQIRFALADIPADAGTNRLPEVLQTALDMADVLERLSNAPITPADPAPESELRAQIKELEATVESLTKALGSAEKAREAAEAKLKANGFWANYKSASGKTVGVGQFAIAGTGIPAGILYLLGPTHPLVIALLKLLG